MIFWYSMFFLSYILITVSYRASFQTSGFSFINIFHLYFHHKFIVEGELVIIARKPLSVQSLSYGNTIGTVPSAGALFTDVPVQHFKVCLLLTTQCSLTLYSVLLARPVSTVNMYL